MPVQRRDTFATEWWIAAVSFLALIAGVSLSYVGGPERSVASYCQTWQTEGQKLHDRWAAQTQGNDDLLGSVATLAGAPQDLADLFDKLAEVAPEEIKADVERYRDAWQQTADNFGEHAIDPLRFLGLQLTVAMQSKGAETRIDNWTSTHCTST
jgi:hypothetical protein